MQMMCPLNSLTVSVLLDVITYKNLSNDILKKTTPEFVELESFAELKTSLGSTHCGGTPSSGAFQIPHTRVS